ncbi:hypothetical protein BGZ96_011474 [Linnemannia gamsii]|uniref:Uncharacterized protein n=1 Tax=Linnemannia gamsii TaxID=64522 RepID=A0ABQ7JT72_9FUNG|nr:hypothetical protein BGZ96_011474 [Linnemannia gamsii]
MIQDPNQPPPGTETDASGKGLQTWQITLIIVATLILMGAVGAVVLVGRIKRQKQKRDTMLSSGDGLESAFGSEMGESRGGRSNRTLIVGGKQKHYLSGDSSGDPISAAAGPAIRTGGGGWRERLSAWRPWDDHGSYHHQQQHPGGLDYNQGQGQGGGLWLMDEPDPHYDRSTAAAGVAAAMRPLSYDASAGLSGPGDTIVGEGGEDPYYYGNYPYNSTQPQDRYYDQEEPAFAASAMATATRGAAGTIHPMDDITTGVQRGPSSVTTAATAMTSRSQQRQLQEQPSRGSVIGQTSPSLVHLERLSAEEGSDYIDSHGLHRQSQDWTLSSVTSTGAGIGTGGGGAAIEDRTLRVDPDQLESHAIFELFRKAPQAILSTSPPQQQDSEGSKSPPLPSAPPPPPSSSTAESDTETVKMLADDHNNKDDNAVSEPDPAVTTLLPVESTPVSKPVSLVSEQLPPPQE